MKLGFVSAILDKSNFEEVISTAKNMGYSCVEVACWPHEEAERRYAGVCHIDVEDLDDDKAEEILKLCHDAQVEISALAYYPNILNADTAKSERCIEHLKHVILAAEKLKVDTVTTFIGRDQNKSVEDNLKLVKEVWPPLLIFAKEHGIRIAIENCPMLFGQEQWPGGQNLMTSPSNWKKVFELLPDDNLGINYYPSHFIWQMIDYIKPIYKFRDKIFHVHCKDIKLFKNRLEEVGTMDYPLSYMSPKIPGLGDVNWSKFISALTDIQYDGNVCVEIEDKAFEKDQKSILDSLSLSKKYLDQYII